ncbi:MAG TPA: hypothetical protein VFZ89_02970, partial [Solirubrobacteraceae bacterium]
MIGVRAALVDGELVAGDVRVEDGRVAEIGLAADPAATGIAVPGFVDVQCNGGYGIDLASEPERLWELAARLPRTGVTAWLPTI